MVRIARNKDSRVLAEMAVQMWDSHTKENIKNHRHYFGGGFGS